VRLGATPRNISPPPARFFLPSSRCSGVLSSKLARVRSAAVLGIDAYLVDVEPDIATGLPTFAPWGSRRAR